jgi:hypothetical protein
MRREDEHADAVKARLPVQRLLARQQQPRVLRRSHQDQRPLVEPHVGEADQVVVHREHAVDAVVLDVAQLQLEEAAHVPVHLRSVV